MVTPTPTLEPCDFETLAECAEIGLWIRDLSGGVLYANRWLEQLFGVNRQALENAEAWLAVIHPDDQARVRARWAACDWAAYREAYRVVRPSGDVVRVEDRTLHVRKDRSGPPVVVGCAGLAGEEAARPYGPSREAPLGDAEVTALLASSRDLAGTLDLDMLLRRILDRLQALIDYTGTGIILREGPEWVAVASRGPFDKEGTGPFPVNSHSRLVARILETRAPLIIDDAADDRAIREDLLGIPRRPPALFSYIRSWMGTPLCVDNEIIGLLFVDHSEPGWFTQHRQKIVLAFSDQVAIAVKNARTYQRAQRRLMELNGVQRATRALLETVELDKILDIACREARALVAAEASAIFAVDDCVPILARQCGPLAMDVEPVRRVALDCCDAAAAGERSGAFCEGELLGRTLLAAALIVRDVNIGALCVARPRGFGEEERRALALLADSVAMAVNAAELAHQGQQLAVMNERQRLAMDLHDTVTQALYGASLLADAAGLALAGERYEGAATNLRKLQDTVNEAMAAMRVMIYELRPPSLEDGLGVAIERRLAAVETRVGLQVNLTVRDEAQLGEDREAQVYWIVIEALNNVIKHAHARAVTVDLRYRRRELVLTISDDGVGIDLAALPERMGLGITGMRERARSIGGALTIESAPGCGCRLTVTAPLR